MIDITVFIISYFIINMIFRIILLLFNSYEKIKLKIYFKKTKKEESYVDFYYKIVEPNEWDFYTSKNDYYIEKWNFEYNNDGMNISLLNMFIFILLPYPISFYRYEYVLEDSFHVIYKDLSKVTYEEIAIDYEEYKQSVLMKYNKDIEVKTRYNNNLKRINNKK